MVRALNLRLEIAGSIPAAALSSATLDKLFTHFVSSYTTVEMTLRYVQLVGLACTLVNGKNAWPQRSCVVYVKRFPAKLQNPIQNELVSEYRA